MLQVLLFLITAFLTNKLAYFPAFVNENNSAYTPGSMHYITDLFYNEFIHFTFQMLCNLTQFIYISRDLIHNIRYLGNGR